MVTARNDLTAGTKGSRYPLRPGFSDGSGAPAGAPSGAPATSGATSSAGRKMVKRESPELFEFKHPGDLLEGVLLFAQKVQIKDRQTQRPKMVMEYTFDVGGGKSKKCLGTYDLDTKIRLSDVGSWVEIAFQGEKQVANGAMRIFDVGVEEKPVAAFADGTQITDADIPF